MMPSIFIGHGAPTIINEKNQYTDFIKQYAKTINKPKAIIIFSAHYESPIQLIGGAEKYSMIYDFYGFDKELYKFDYPCIGDVNIAKNILDLLQSSIQSKIDSNRGIDHGSWSVLSLLYPKADIPVVQMSVNINLTPKQQFEIGRTIRKLKEQDVLIVCSGGIVHNLGKVDFSAKKADIWAIQFNQWISEKLENWDIDALCNYETLSPNLNLAVPRSEHFIPLLIAMGAGSDNKHAHCLKSIYQYGNLSLDFWEFE